MPTPQLPLDDLSCSECGTEVVIYKGWATFKNDKIIIQNGAKWRCPNCGETGLFDRREE